MAALNRVGTEFGIVGHWQLSISKPTDISKSLAAHMQQSLAARQPQQAAPQVALTPPRLQEMQLASSGTVPSNDMASMAWQAPSMSRVISIRQLPSLEDMMLS
jgi:hypothetical protein